jgi:hypothetical protein
LDQNLALLAVGTNAVIGGVVPQRLDEFTTVNLTRIPQEGGTSMDLNNTTDWGC